jgi:hypothetical protein
MNKMFTNVPTCETIEIILKKAYPKNTKYFHEITK